MNNAGQFRIYADVPPVQHDEQLEKYRDAGFTHYIMTEDYIKMRDERGQISSSYIDTLKKLRQMGFRVLIRNHGDGPDYFDGITTQLKPYADGFYMCDEPSYVPVPEYASTYISNLKKLVDWYNNYGNNTFFHINLLQTYGVEMLHNQYSYSQYLDHYVEDILKNVKGKKTLSTDFYPLSYDEKNNYCIKKGYLYNLVTISDKAKELKASGHDVELSFCIQVFSEEGLRLRPIERIEDIRFQVAVSIAMGAKNLEYYLWASNLENDGVIDKKTQTCYTSAYEFIKKVNQELKTLEKEITNFDWNGAMFCKGTQYHDLSAFYGTDEQENKSFKNLKNIECSVDSIVGEFVDGDNRGYMFVNFSEPSLNLKDDITFECNKQKCIACCNGNLFEICPCNGKFSFSVEAGSYIFLKFSE